MKKLITLILIAGFSTAQAQWSEDFESYTTGSWPTTWTADANATDNSTNYVDNTISYAGSKSLRVFGSLGGCWGALAYHPLAINPPFEIELAVRNGNESLTGCHPYGAYIGLRKGTSWANPSRKFIDFRNDSIFGSRGIFLGAYTISTWYIIKVRYEKPSSSTVKLSYWINGISKGSETLSAIADEDQLTNLDLTVQEGSAWFDGLTVDNYMAPNLSVDSSSLTICWASGCDGNFNISSNISWTLTDNQSWLSVTPSSSSNDGVVTVSASTDNPTTSGRTAIVTVSGSGVSDQIVTVTQEGKPSSINENELSSLIKIYPNPVLDKLTVEFVESYKVEGLKLFDLFGKLVFVRKDFKEKEIDLSEYGEGIYFLEVETEEGIVRKKVLVVR